MSQQLSLTIGGGMKHGLPVGIGKVLDGQHPGSYNVQTPDSMWSIMFKRMQKQVDRRAAAMARWEAMQPRGARADHSYWESYNAERAKHRIDYPMPWGHVMFGSDVE